VEALAVLSAWVLILSGALAAIYFRPYSHRAPGHVGRAVAAVAALRATHRVACWTLVAAAAGLVVLARPWRRSAGGGAGGRASVGLGATAAGGGATADASCSERLRGPRALAAALAVLGGFLLSGFATPWESLLPWALPMGANMARPMPLLGHDGPFPELVGVNVAYDDTVRAIGRLRLGPRGVGRLCLAHSVVLPLGAALAVVIAVRRRARGMLGRRS
jgi:hypothetical protein